MRYENDWLISATKILGFIVLLLGLIWGAIFFVSQCQAQCAPDIESRSEVVVVDGEQGIWFHRDVAACMLQDLRELQLLRVRATLLEERLELRDRQYGLLQETTELGTQALTDSQEMVGELSSQLVKIEAERDAWWRSPYLWSALGIAMGVGITVWLLI